MLFNTINNDTFRKISRTTLQKTFSKRTDEIVVWVKTLSSFASNSSVQSFLCSYTNDILRLFK